MTVASLSHRAEFCVQCDGRDAARRTGSSATAETCQDVDDDDELPQVSPSPFPLARV